MPTDRAHATSDQLTTALQRTVALMSGELEKSGYSAQLLEESSDTIAQVSQRYTSFNELLRNSISLVRQMERAELMDLGMLVGSMAFFAACVLYILYVRVLSKGLWALGLTWKATGYVGSGALGGVSSLAAMVSSAAHPTVQPPQPVRDALEDWMPRGYRDEDVVYEDPRVETRCESGPAATGTIVSSAAPSFATHESSTTTDEFDTMAKADVQPETVAGEPTQSVAPLPDLPEPTATSPADDVPSEVASSKMPTLAILNDATSMAEPTSKAEPTSTAEPTSMAEPTSTVDSMSTAEPTSTVDPSTGGPTSTGDRTSMAIPMNNDEAQSELFDPPSAEVRDSTIDVRSTSASGSEHHVPTSRRARPWDDEL